MHLCKVVEKVTEVVFPFSFRSMLEYFGSALFNLSSVWSKCCTCVLQDQTDVFIQQLLGGFNHRTSDDKKTIP